MSQELNQRHEPVIAASKRVDAAIEQLISTVTNYEQACRDAGIGSTYGGPSHPRFPTDNLEIRDRIGAALRNINRRFAPSMIGSVGALKQSFADFDRRRLQAMALAEPARKAAAEFEANGVVKA